MKKITFFNVGTNVLTYCLLIVVTFLARKVFLENLSLSIVGLGSLIQNLIGFLSLAELGISSAIIFSLYQPIKEDNRERVQGLMRLYRTFYRWLGVFILMSGLLLLIVLPIFLDRTIAVGEARVYFLLFLLNTVLTYLFTYKFGLLYAYHRGFIVVWGDFIFKLLLNGIQIFLLIEYQSYLLYLIAMVSINIVYMMMLNLYIEKKYHWAFDLTKKVEVKDKGIIFANIKALFWNRISKYVVFSTDNIIIGYFLGLTSVGIYVNYSLILIAVGAIIGKFFEGFASTLGSFFVDNDKAMNYTLYKRLFFLNFWLTGCSFILLFFLINPFISWWVGEEFLLAKNIVIVLLINFYITTLRECTDRFKDSAGLYKQDKVPSILEASLNLIFSLIFVHFFGLLGVFLGTLVGNLIVVCWLKPRVVYTFLFEKPIKEFFLLNGVYLIILLIPFALIYGLVKWIEINESLPALFGWGFAILIVVNGCFFFLCRGKEELAYFIGIVKRISTKSVET